MLWGLKTRLSLYFILVALVCVALISVMANISMEKQFRSYTQNNQEQKNKEFADLISRQYSRNSAWDMEEIENIGMNALQQGLVIKLSNSDGQIIWDAVTHNNGYCKQMMDNIVKKMSTQYPDWNGSYVSSKYPILYNKTTVGSISIGYYGPFYYNDNDLAFIKTLNNIIISVGIISLVFAFALGSFIAYRLSSPITKAVNAARNISEGNFSDRIEDKSRIIEIYQLTEEINNLALKLEKQESLRKRLTADVAHELRTPLTTVQSHLEAIVDGVWKPDTDKLKLCYTESIRLGKLIGNLEELARYDYENLELIKAEYSLSSQIQDILKSFEPLFDKKKIKLDSKIEELVIFADRDRLSQVFYNVFSNSLKYTPAGGKVSINTESDIKNLKVIIKDSGIGIPQEDLPFIFERFYRVDKSRTKSTGGAGIGLTIARSILQAHNGSIRVESEVGQGTEFIVTLPREIPS